MNIHVSEEAAKWYRKELELREGDSIRFFARYSNTSPIHPGYSLGISVEQPKHPGFRTEAGGLTFFMEEHDLWYLRGYRLNVKYLDSIDDIDYVYEEEAEA
ncbi:HesB/YadR/YfhF family protein [Paenibacillus sediminis]|uniref:Uncharacterized protein YneR n=1 Tax=Paenibacillus sediminis TaxID=664909 RepID=A0ABS4H1H4_9BACL|nr:HesB/YadR/YfhF family protein [Paenibacillus sediminis]MBP1936326.1 uncharacterized protein YneR [Paenibacillus sediminis]